MGRACNWGQRLADAARRRKRRCHLRAQPLGTVYTEEHQALLQALSEAPPSLRLTPVQAWQCWKSLMCNCAPSSLPLPKNESEDLEEKEESDELDESDESAGLANMI